MSSAFIQELNLFGQCSHFTKCCLIGPLPRVLCIFSILNVFSSLTQTFCSSSWLNVNLLLCFVVTETTTHDNNFTWPLFIVLSIENRCYFFEIRTLWPTLNLYGCFVCLRGISSSDRDLETRTSSSLYGLTSFRLVSIVRWYVLLWNNERFLWDGRYIVGIV